MITYQKTVTKERKEEEVSNQPSCVSIESDGIENIGSECFL